MRELHELMEEYGVIPAASYPDHHPKVALGVGGFTVDASKPPPLLPIYDLWSAKGETSSVPTANTLYRNSSVVFFAYDYPMPFSSNTGYESDNSMVTFLVQGDDCQTYLLVLVDKPGDSSGGYAWPATQCG